MRTMAASPEMYGEWNNEHAHHSFNGIEKRDNHSPVLVTENATYEE